MVDTLLDASRIGATGAPVRLEAVELSALVEQARGALGAEANGREINVQIAEDMPLIGADALLASRALSNIISNALRYGGDGAVDIAARRDGDDIVLEISDRGPGLGAEAERLFAPFVRGVLGDGRAPGLGLGLSIARKFLGAQGATITAENRKGGGALFSVRFACAGGQHVD